MLKISGRPKGVSASSSASTQNGTSIAFDSRQARTAGPVRRIDREAWTLVGAAAAAGLSGRRAALQWLARYRAGGEPQRHDRRSTPARCRTPVPTAGVAPRRRRCSPRCRLFAEIERLRRTRMSGPAIARRLGMARSTVGPVLRRLGLPRRPAPLEAKPPVIRYERPWPGEPIHLATKKLGRIGGIGHRGTICWMCW